jgi:predicted membrane-bound spermidine synthase
MKKISLLALIPLAIGIAAALFRSLWIEPSHDPAHIAKMALQLSAITYAIAFVLGAPAYLLIRRFGLRAAWQVTLIGAVLGALSGALLPLIVGEANAKQFFSGLYPYPLEYAMFGAVTAFVAWWFVLAPRTLTKE